MNTPRWPRRGLYLLTPDEPDTGRLLARLQPLLATRPALVQYRNKLAGRDLVREQATAVLAACRAANIPMLVNDDWRLAAGIGADGAHLGEHDGVLAEARTALGPGAILGASCYDSLERARAAAAAGASYIAFGAFFPSGTKPGARHAHPGLLRESAGLGLPRVAIGGLTPDNAAPVIAAGADLLAVIGAVFDAPDPVAVARAFTRLFATTSHENTRP